MSEEFELSEQEWIELFKMAEQHKVLPIIYDMVSSSPSTLGLSDRKREFFEQKVVRQVLVQERKTEEFLALYRKLLEDNLTPVVVKGIVCRQLYSVPSYRSSGDEDVLVPKEQFADCDRIFRENGMEYLKPYQTLDGKGEISYIRKNGFLHIELHKELFSSHSEAYGNFNDFFQTAFERKIQMVIEGVSVYTFDYTDHLLYLILHALKHFLHSGFGIRQVCDIILYANQYGALIDWEYLHRSCARVHAENFAAAIFDIGEKKLNFQKTKACYSPAWCREQVDGDALLDDLLKSGVFGGSSMSRKHSSNMTLSAAAAERKGKSRKSPLYTSLFPDREYMAEKYSYLEKYPFLLPVAWGSRIVQYYKETKNMENNQIKESVSIGNERIQLLKKYKIIR